MLNNIKTMQRIGIYGGSFDPVHAGHVSFALQALDAARLDAIYFLPERRPRDKAGVEHFGHRVAMLRRAVRPHRGLKVLELEDISFSIDRTLPRLRKRFQRQELVLLVGSDVAIGMPEWPNFAGLCKQVELVVGIRANDDPDAMKQLIADWEYQPRAITLFNSYAPGVSSGKIRDALRRRQRADGLLKSVERYSDSNWLYVSLAAGKTSL